jgi:hypothetical protein
MRSGRGEEAAGQTGRHASPDAYGDAAGSDSPFVAGSLVAALGPVDPTGFGGSGGAQGVPGGLSRRAGLPAVARAEPPFVDVVAVASTFVALAAVGLCLRPVRPGGSIWPRLFVGPSVDLDGCMTVFDARLVRTMRVRAPRLVGKRSALLAHGRRAALWRSLALHSMIQAPEPIVLARYPSVLAAQAVVFAPNAGVFVPNASILAPNARVLAPLEGGRPGRHLPVLALHATVLPMRRPIRASRAHPTIMLQIALVGGLCQSRGAGGECKSGHHRAG